MTERPTAEHEAFKGQRDLASAQVGDAIGSVEFTITPQMVERTAWANDDYNPWYMQGSPFGGRIASPMAALAFDGSLFYDYYKYPAGGSLFAKQEFEFLAPLRVGEPYRMTGTLVDRYRRRGRTYFRMGLSVVDSEGAEVMRMVKTVATPVKAEPETEVKISASDGASA
jgi:acyl dehydratase